MSMDTGNMVTTEIPLTEPSCDILKPAFPADGSSVEELPTSLACLASKAAFAYVIPQLRDAFENIRQPGYSVLETLSSNIRELQEAFAQALYSELSQRDVNFSIKLSLRLDKNAKLALVGEHPDSGAIVAMLQEKPDFSDTFVEIAAQSAAMRDLRNLSTLISASGAENSYRALAALPGENTYQVSLKGEMNHFYFTHS